LDPKTIAYGKNGTGVLYPYAKFSGDWFTHGNVRTKIREFSFFFFCLSVKLGMAYFGFADLMQCLARLRSTASPFIDQFSLGLGHFLEEET